MPSITFILTIHSVCIQCSVQSYWVSHAFAICHLPFIACPDMCPLSSLDISMLYKNQWDQYLCLLWRNIQCNIFLLLCRRPNWFAFCITLGYFIVQFVHSLVCMSLQARPDSLKERLAEAKAVRMWTGKWYHLVDSSCHPQGDIIYRERAESRGVPLYLSTVEQRTRVSARDCAICWKLKNIAPGSTFKQFSMVSGAKRLQIQGRFGTIHSDSLLCFVP